MNVNFPKLESKKKPIDIILVGMGFMGIGLASHIFENFKDQLRIPLIISRRPKDTCKLLNELGYKAKIVSNLNELVHKDYVGVSDNLDLIMEYPNEIVVEMTGTIPYGTEVALKTINSGKHLITMNPEMQVTVGSRLKELADKKGVIVTDSIGDQPGSLARLIGQANTLGFQVLMAGNMKRFLNRYATQEEMQAWADAKGLAVRQTVSFTDGTKQAIEMNLVSNHFGMGILKPNMEGPQIETFEEIKQSFDWNKIGSQGVVDYGIGLKLFPGVFIACKHKNKRQHSYLKYLGMGDGPIYILFEPYHLCHLEAYNTIKHVTTNKEAIINNGDGGMTLTAAKAKRNLMKGEYLDGIGGNTVYGCLERTNTITSKYLPVGFAENAKLKRNIDKDQTIKLTDVELPTNAATKLMGLV